MVEASSAFNLTNKTFGKVLKTWNLIKLNRAGSIPYHLAMIKLFSANQRLKPNPLPTVSP